MDKPRTIRGWRAAYAAVDRLLRGNYAELIGGDTVVMWLEQSVDGDYAVAHWDKPEEREGWSVSPVSCDEALELRRKVSPMGKYPFLRRV